MELNRDWRLPVALIVVGLVFLVALGGRNDNDSPFRGDEQGRTIVINGNDNSQPRIVVGNGDPEASVGVAPPAPYAPPVAPGLAYGPMHRSGFGPPWPIFLLIGLALLFFFFRSQGRRNWQGPGPGGSGPGSGQSYQTQGPQPGQGKGHWAWHSDEQAPAPTPAQNHGDITRPGQGDQS
ncbi:MAG: hypothetical protein ABIO92_09870 [Chloroflexia bacterium]